MLRLLVSANETNAENFIFLSQSPSSRKTKRKQTVRSDVDFYELLLARLGKTRLSRSGTMVQQYLSSSPTSNLSINNCFCFLLLQRTSGSFVVTLATKFQTRFSLVHSVATRHSRRPRSIGTSAPIRREASVSSASKIPTTS